MIMKPMEKGPASLLGFVEGVAYPGRTVYDKDGFADRYRKHNTKSETVI
jgi:hypothetical protein